CERTTSVRQSRGRGCPRAKALSGRVSARGRTGGGRNRASRSCRGDGPGAAIPRGEVQPDCKESRNDYGAGVGHWTRPIAITPLRPRCGIAEAMPRCLQGSYTTPIPVTSCTVDDCGGGRGTRALPALGSALLLFLWP